MKKYSLFSVVCFTVLLLFAVGGGVSAASTGPWDISQGEDGSVLAQVEKNPDNQTYTLKITATVAKGVIRDFETYEDPGWKDAYGSKITVVTVGNGVTEIGKNAFYQLKQAAKLTVQGDVSRIGKNAFYGFGAEVTDTFAMTFRGDVGTLENYAFYNAGRAAGKIDILFQGDIGTISTDAFANLGYEAGKSQASTSGYQGHLNFTVNGDVETLAYHSFFNAALNADDVPMDVNFTFNGDVKLLAEAAFKNLLGNSADAADRRITLNIVFAGSLYRWQQNAFDHVGYDIGKNNPQSLSSVTVNRGLADEIPDRCFYEFSKRAAITLNLPNLKTVGAGAFLHCGAESFDLQLNGVENTLPQQVKYVAESAFGWVGTAVTVPQNSNAAVGKDAFDNYTHPQVNWTTFDADSAFTPKELASGDTGVTVAVKRVTDGSSANLTTGEILTAELTNDGSLYADEDLFLLATADSGEVQYLSAPYSDCEAVWCSEDGYYTQDFRYFIADKNAAALTVKVFARSVDGAGQVKMTEVASTSPALTSLDVKTAVTALNCGLFAGDTVSIGELLCGCGLPFGDGLTVTALSVGNSSVLSADSKFALTGKTVGKTTVTFSGKTVAAYGNIAFTNAVLTVEVTAKPELSIGATSVNISNNPVSAGWEYALIDNEFATVKTEFTLIGLYPGQDYRLLYRHNNGTAGNPRYTVFSLPFTTVAGYDIQISTVQHGYGKASVAAAAKGDTVTLTAYPYAGFDLQNWEVTDEKGKKVTVTDGKFIMPDSKVTVTPYFIAADYTISVLAVEHGAVIASKTAALAGSEVELTAYPEDGYKLSKITVKTLQGAAITVEDNAFIMPAESVKVIGEFVWDAGIDRYLETVNHKSYLNGYEDGTLRPEGNLTRAEAAQLFYSLLKNKDVTEFSEFSDVTAENWYEHSVGIMAGLGFIKGYEDGTFRGDRLITRAEFTAIAVRFANACAGQSNFPDVADNFWGLNAINTAVAYGWIKGYEDGTFRPENNITRAEAVTVINRMLERHADKNYIAEHPEKLKAFTDLNADMWYYEQMVEAANAHEYSRDSDGYNEIWVQ